MIVEKELPAHVLEPDMPFLEVAGWLSACTWPRTISEAYARGKGPYTYNNAVLLIAEEPIELYNGWLVWQEMTDIDERRILNTILLMLDLAARQAGFGQTLPDQADFLMATGEVTKPDLCLISNARLAKIKPMGRTRRPTLRGGPELAIEVRSPSNRRTEEQKKRALYFANGVQIVWDVDLHAKKIWVYRAANPQHAQEYGLDDMIDCEPFLPGWRRRLADMFDYDVPLAVIAPELINATRAEGEAQTLRRTLLRMAQMRFAADLPSDLAGMLETYPLERLRDLEARISTAPTLAEWLGT